MFNELKDMLKDTGRHLSTGSAYMIPVLAAGSLATVLMKLLGFTGWAFLEKYNEFQTISLSLFIPVMAAYIAFAIADRPGIGPGLILGYLATEIGTGFLGAMLAGLLAGYITYILVRKVNVPDSIKTTWNTLSPAFTVLIVGTLLFFVIGPPIAALVNVINNWLAGMAGSSIALLGAVIGLMVGFDFGGPINKIAFVFCLGMLEQGMLVPMALFMSGAAVPSLGQGLATFLAPKLYSDEEKNMGRAAVALGALVGFSEGAIPFAVTDYFRVVISSMLGCAVAGVLGGLFGLELPVPSSGLLGVLVFNKPLMYLVAVFTGAIVTAVTVIALKGIGKKKETKK